jgi:hypothetical protein
MSEDSVEVDKNLYEVLTNYGLDAAIKFAEERNTQDLIKKGTELTQDIKEFIVKASFQEVKTLTITLRKISLPESLTKLFEFTTKKDAVRFAEKELVIDHKEFVELIMNAEHFGFYHARKHKEFIPEHLQSFDPSPIGKRDPESGKLSKEGKKAFSKISSIFKQRRQLNVHWFYFAFEWHCFFFDYSDLMSGHWAAGDHIHYISYLWGIPGDQVWNGFDSRDYSPAKAHIRYTHDYRQR